MKRTPKKENHIKAACVELNRIILVKKLTDKQKKVIVNKLIELVRKSVPGNFTLNNYVEIVIKECLTNEEKVVFINTYDDLSKSVKDNSLFRAQMVSMLHAYYTTIVQYYPEFGIDFILYNINEELPKTLIIGNPLGEMEFEKSLDKEILKKDKPTSKEKFKTLEDFKNLNSFLRNSIIGQNEAIDKVCDALKLKAVGFSKWVSFFFLGKTGRGKTQLAKKLSERYLENFWRIDCGEFQQGHEIHRLLGAPPGYIGHTTESLMKVKADKTNKWIILFDEIEKAHPKIYNFLLALLDNGRVTDNIGNELDFSESVFIFTSNCGMSELKDDTINWKKSYSQEADKECVLKALDREFPAEFRGRVDEFIFFNDLTKEDIEKITKNALKEYPIKITQELVNFIINKGYSEKYGARNLEKVIKMLVGLPIANKLLENKIPIDGTSKFDAGFREGNLEIINTISLVK